MHFDRDNRMDDELLNISRIYLDLCGVEKDKMKMNKGNDYIIDNVMNSSDCGNEYCMDNLEKETNEDIYEDLCKNIPHNKCEKTISCKKYKVSHTALYIMATIFISLIVGVAILTFLFFQQKRQGKIFVNTKISYRVNIDNSVLLYKSIYFTIILQSVPFSFYLSFFSFSRSEDSFKCKCGFDY